MNSGFRHFQDDDSEEYASERTRRRKMIAVAAAIAVCLSVLISSEPNLLRSSSQIPIVLVISFLSSAIMGTLVGRRRPRSVEKRKRGLEDGDMYTLIDRMVDDLDEDEFDYLRRRLEDREHGTKARLAESLDDLLTQRSEHHDTNQS